MNMMVYFGRGKLLVKVAAVRPTPWKFGNTERTFFHNANSRIRSLGLASNSVYCFRGYTAVYKAFLNNGENHRAFRRFQLVIEGRRAQSTSASTQIPNLTELLPEPPVPPVNVPVDVILDSGLEPTLASQGLAGWTPPGLLQCAMEFLHINLDIPWWLAIAIGTVVVRICLFPLIIASQKNAANMNNNMPRMQLLQLKMTEARASGNALEAARYGQEMMTFMKEKNLSPVKSMLIPMAQAPIFISFFFGLRGMANLPVESMKEGGLWWFTNLTVPDPLYLLPLITSATLFLTIELGAEGGIRSGNLQTMKYVLRALPICIFPFVINFPSAILCYWVTANAVSLVQVAVLRMEPVRAYFNISKINRADPKDLPMKKGFIEGFRESMRNAKITGEMESRSRFDEVNFRKAGTGPVPKTYAYDPTKQASPSKKVGKKL